MQRFKPTTKQLQFKKDVAANKPAKYTFSEDNELFKRKVIAIVLIVLAIVVGLPLLVYILS